MPGYQDTMTRPTTKLLTFHKMTEYRKHPEPPDSFHNVVLAIMKKCHDVLLKFKSPQIGHVKKSGFTKYMVAVVIATVATTISTSPLAAVFQLLLSFLSRARSPRLDSLARGGH